MSLSVDASYTFILITSFLGILFALLNAYIVSQVKLVGEENVTLQDRSKQHQSHDILENNDMENHINAVSSKGSKQ